MRRIFTLITILSLAFMMPLTTNAQEAFENLPEEFKEKVKKKNAETQYDMGSSYYTGFLGVKKDYEKAIFCFQQAADQNHPEALWHLGICYAVGTGVEKDIEKAKGYMKRSADLGYEPAQTFLDELKKNLLDINDTVDKQPNEEPQQSNPQPTEDKKLISSQPDKQINTNEVKSPVDLNNPKTGHDIVDTKIAVNEKIDSNTFVVIIANEHYKYEQPVPYAINDGEIFRLYCEKTLGIPKKNIHYSSDATLNDMRMQLFWLQKIMNAYDGEARAIVYYSGHGMPDEEGLHSYLLPVDGNSTMPYSCLRTSDVYKQLEAMPSTSIYVFFDACFSGARRDGHMLSMSRGVAIKPKKDIVNGKVVVFSAAQGNETAYSYSEKKHGLFTYYLLQLLQEKGGYVDLGYLSDFVTKQVKRTSIIENNKEQTPSVIVSLSNTNWRNLPFAKARATQYETISLDVKTEESSPKVFPVNDNKVKVDDSQGVSTKEKDSQYEELENLVTKFTSLYGVKLLETKISEIETLYGVKSKKDKVDHIVTLKDETEFKDKDGDGTLMMLCIDPRKAKKDFPSISNLNWKSSYKEWNEWFTSHGFKNQPYNPYYSRQSMLVYSINGLEVILMFDGKESSHGTWFSLIIAKGKPS